MISSLRVPAGLRATVWEHPNYAGRGLVITGPVDLPDISRWSFDNIISSFKMGKLKLALVHIVGNSASSARPCCNKPPVKCQSILLRLFS